VGPWRWVGCYGEGGLLRGESGLEMGERVWMRGKGLNSGGNGVYISASLLVDVRADAV